MSDDLRPGTILGDRYRIDVLLGEGGMGRVYAAEHVLMRKRLAVKVLHRELTSVPDVVLRFEREAMAAAHIEHPNVAAATDFGKLPDGSVFLVLEYVQGKSLREEIAEGPMVVERALHIARQIGLALASAHELKIVHRDLKPENVMLVHKGGDPDFVKVLDFGIAKVPIGETEESVGKSITKAGMIFGTPEYMAPEQALGQNVDGRADLYALGVITYEMLSGVRPFTSHAEMGILGQQLANPPPSFAERAPGLAIPPQVEQLVLRLLAKEVDQRFQRAKEVVMTIDSLLGVSGSYRGSLITMSGGSSRESQATDPADAGSAGPRRSASGEAAGPVLAPPKLTNMGDFGWKIDVSALPLGENSGVVEPVASEPVPAAPEAIPEPPAGFDPIGPVANGVPAPQPALMPRRRQSSRYKLSLALGRLAALPAIAFGRLQGALDALTRTLDSRRKGLPEGVARALAKVPSRTLALALLVAGTLLLVGLIGLTIAALMPEERVGSRPIGSPAPSAERKESPEEQALRLEIEASKKSGLAALEALSKKHPKSAKVQVALAEGRIDNHQYLAATQAIKSALALDPAVNEDPAVERVLSRTVQIAASSQEALSLLRGPMGSKGADILYNLSRDSKAPNWARVHARRYLESEAFEQTASPALKLAVQLGLSKKCEDYAVLLPQALQVGDERALEYLEPLTKTTGCAPSGKGDCYACLRGDSALSDAIAAARTRSP